MGLAWIVGQALPSASAGMVWLRYHVAVPPDRSPLAVRLDRDKGACSLGVFWLNGVHVGSQGRFPPQPFATERCVTGVFEMPGGVVVPGGAARWMCRASNSKACMYRPNTWVRVSTVMSSSCPNCSAALGIW